LCLLAVALQEGKVYTFEELSDSSAAIISQRHAEMRDAGKEIGKLLSSSNRVLKVGQCYARLQQHLA
jgi:dynein heavy chain